MKIKKLPEIISKPLRSEQIVEEIFTDLKSDSEVFSKWLKLSEALAGNNCFASVGNGLLVRL